MLLLVCVAYIYIPTEVTKRKVKRHIKFLIIFVVILFFFFFFKLTYLQSLERLCALYLSLSLVFFRYLFGLVRKKKQQPNK